ncbi:hypothetical protein [Pseudochrobactrum sp. XF203]|uniref:hypothetical protein n=1 Tax=Pseudochrobactrum sp. XF203 TaxID=2879116 RepID=UPI001CE346D5|nr:hypothetical protein [Pseudochrobactrum sp. XF203]UCA44760.1 hypothetical protein LDL70_10260 [Pseudochrobactrum sp. XF203]
MNISDHPIAQIPADFWLAMAFTLVSVTAVISLIVVLTKKAIAKCSKNDDGTDAAYRETILQRIYYFFLEFLEKYFSEVMTVMLHTVLFGWIISVAERNEAVSILSIVIGPLPIFLLSLYTTSQSLIRLNRKRLSFRNLASIVVIPIYWSAVMLAFLSVKNVYDIQFQANVITQNEVIKHDPK